MAYGLKYYFVDKKLVGTTDTTYTFEILEDGYSGSTTEWIGVDIRRQFEELSFRRIEQIQKSLCGGVVRVVDATQRSAIETIAGSEIGDYKVQLKRDGTVIWTGLVVPDLISIGEQNYGNQSAEIIAKDLFFTGDYPLTTIFPDTRGTEKAIVLIADILDNLGYGLDIVSYTVWTEDSVTESDDILNQSYHEKERFRIFAQNEGESDKPLSNQQALEYILKAYGLILRQVNGKWNLVQVTAFSNPASVRRYVYNSSGTQTSSSTSYSLGSSAVSDELYVLGSSSNNYFAGLKKSTSKFQHDSLIQGIKFQREYWIDDAGEIAKSQFWQADGTGNLELFFVTWFAKTTDTDLGNPVVASVSIYVDTGTTDYYWNGTSWVTSPATIEVEVEETYSTTDSDGNYLYKNNGLSIVTDPIPDGADGDLNVKITPDSLQPNYAYWYLRSLDFNLAYSDTQEGVSSAIVFELEQTKNYSDVYDYGTYYFGDGPTSASLSALKDSSDNLLTLWKRSGDASTITHQQLLLSEFLNTRRNQRRNIRATLYGEYEPEDVLSYDSTNFFFLGGSWSSRSYVWQGNFVELNEETGTDTLNTFYETEGGASSSGAVGSTSGTVGSSGSYLEKGKNLSDVPTPSTARTNLGLAIGTDVQAQNELLEDISGLTIGDGTFLVGDGSGDIVAESGNTARTSLGLGTGDSPTFAGLTVDGLVVEDEVRDLQSDVIENHLEIESLQDNKVEKGQLFPNGDEQALGTGDAVNFSTVNTGQGDNELYAMDQPVRSTDDVTFSTVDTGQGANELYAMDQDVQQADSPTFSRVVLTNQADDGTKAVRADRNVSAGNGVTGGGDLTADRTLTLGTPSTTTVGGSNAVTTGSHTHALDLSGRSITLSDDADSVITFDTNTQDLGADRTFTPTIADHASGQRGVLNDGTSAQTIYGDKTFDGALTADDSILLDDTAKFESEAGYVSGFTGSGFNLSKVSSLWRLELDDMYIRGALFASEFIVNQISAVNGSDILSPGRGKVEEISSNFYTVSDPQGGNFASFAVNDIVIVQQVRPNDNQIVKRIVKQVTDVTDNVIELATLSGAPTDSGSIEIGDLIVAIGNTSNADRQANIFRTVTDSDSPYVRVNDGIASWADWTGIDKLKLQYGNLDSLTSTYSYSADPDGAYPAFEVSGYGFFSDNAYLTGEFRVGDLQSYGDFIEYNNTDGLKIKIGDDDLSTAIAEIRSDLIDIYLADQSTFAGIQFLSGQITLKVGADGKVASARLDATGDESAITLRADFFDFQSNDIVILGDPNQDAGTEAKIALGSNVDTITVANTDSGFIASGAGEFKGYIDANNYLRLDSSGLDIKSEEFKLQAGELVIDSTQDKKIKIANATEEIIAIGDFDFPAEVEDSTTASATSSSTTATLTNATPTNSDTNMDTGIGTLNSNVAQDSPIVTLLRTYNVTGKWVRVQFDYNAPPFDDSAFNEYAVGFSITYFGEQIQELNRNPLDSSAVSGSIDKTLFVPDTATFNTIQVQSLASSGGLSSSDEHSKINVSNLSVTVYDDTYSYTDIGNDGFRVYNSGGRKKIEFKDGNATATLDQLSIGSWDFELASNGDLVLKYEGSTVQTFTKPT